MTKHGKIGSGPDKRPSLFERADEAFGLDRLGPAKVPDNLPEPAARMGSRPSQQKAEDVAAAPPSQNLQDYSQLEAASASSKELEAEVQLAAELSGPKVTIDRELLREQGLIVPEDPVTGLLEEFRIVKRELIADARASEDPRARRILICSPHSGEGKTYCATNLAIALAGERDIEVLLVDADVVRPRISERLGIEPAKGLMDALADATVKPEEIALETDVPGLFILPAGRSTANAAELIASARTSRVLDRLTVGAPHRFVIFDTPPALAASPVAELAGHVGQAVLVARADETSRAAL
ncbi:MAG: AAA family ATPase, partial [Pseudomonadota bacterium]